MSIRTLYVDGGCITGTGKGSSLCETNGNRRRREGVCFESHLSAVKSGFGDF